MYVKCTDNRYYENKLTVGKIYKVRNRKVWRYETKEDCRFPIWEYEILGDDVKYTYALANEHFQKASKSEIIDEILNKFDEDKQYLVLELINKIEEVNLEVDLSKSDVIDIYELIKE